MLIEKLSEITDDVVVPKRLLEKKEDKPRIRISSLGKDLMWCYNEIVNPQEVDDKLERIFHMGQWCEQYLFAKLQGNIYNIDKVVHTNIMDINNSEITGEIDCMAKDDFGTEYIVDVKSMSSNSFEKLVVEQNIKESHYIYYVQLQMYMYFLDVEDGMILAYNKNNSELAEVYTTLDREFAENQIERIHKLREHILNKTEPQMEYPSEVRVKTQKVRNKEEYKGLGVAISAPHKLNRFNPYIDTEIKSIDAPETKDKIYTERNPILSDNSV